MKRAKENENRMENGYQNGHILVRIKDVFFDYDGSPILQQVNLELLKGTSYSLIGKSGTGKSTLLNLIAGFLQPSKGNIEIQGRSAIMFQELALFPWQTVYQAAAMPLRLSGLKDKKLISENVMKVLTDLGLGELKNKYPHQLSGGERQRAALARGLIGNPDLLLMDEPTSSLDSVTRESIQELIRRQQQKAGAALLFVTHDMEEALILGEKILILNGDGSVSMKDNPCYGGQNQRKNIAFYEQCIYFKGLLEKEQK